jgi:hypothetical protein
MSEPNEVITDFAELLVRDYLKSRKLDKTLAILNEESRSVGAHIPRVDSWYRMSEALDLPTLLQQNAKQADRQFNTVAEVLLQRLVSEQNTRLRAPVRLDVSYSAPRGSLSPSLSESVLNFQVPRTTPFQDQSSVPMRPAEEQFTVTNLMPKTIIKADFEPDGSVMFPPTAPVDEKFRMPERIEEDPKALQVALAKEKKQKAKEKAAQQQKQQPLIPKATIRQRKRGETEKKSNQAWIPMAVRSRRIERDMAVLKQNLEEEVKRTGFVETASKRTSLTELEQNQAEEKYRLKRKKKCGLCFREHSVVNLVLNVPHKAIVDLQNMWTEKYPWVEMNERQVKKYQNPVKTRFFTYDEESVCVYCAQFFVEGQQEVYRPSVDSTRAHKREQMRTVAAQKAKAYWDPLKTVELDRAREAARLLEEKEQLGSPTSDADSTFA